MANIPLYNIFSTDSSVTGHSDRFHALEIGNRAAVDTGLHAYLRILASSRFMTRNGIARMYGNSVLSFSRSPHTILHRGYTNLHYHDCPVGIIILTLQRRKLNLKDTVALLAHSGSKWRRDWNLGTQVLRPTTFSYECYSWGFLLFLNVNKC